MIKKLKAIWNLLWSDDFFLATYYNDADSKYAEIEYVDKDLDKEFCDSILEHLNSKYDHLL